MTREEFLDILDNAECRRKNEEKRKSILGSRKSELTEHTLQVKCVRWFRSTYKDVMIWATPNGTFCSHSQAVKLVSEGVVSGVPDLFVAEARQGFHGLFIEMKNGKAGKVSANQDKVMDYLGSKDYKCVVCRYYDEFQKIVNDYML